MFSSEFKQVPIAFPVGDSVVVGIPFSVFHVEIFGYESLRKDACGKFAPGEGIDCLEEVAR